MKARLAILTCTLIWGGSFVVFKGLTASMPFGWVLVIRFSIAAILVHLVFIKDFKYFKDKRTIKGGAIVGVVLFFAYYFQTTGLIYTTPGKNAFITALYCAFIPLIVWVLDKKRPTVFNFVAVVLALAGLALVSLSGDMGINKGDALTFVSAFFFALQIYFVSKHSDCNLGAFTFWQFLVAGTCFLVYSLLFSEVPDFSSLTLGDWGSLFYLTFFATFSCILLQNYGQRNLPPASAGLLLTTESVFGAGISVCLGYEDLTVKLVAGFCLIFFALVLSEAGPEIVNKLRKRE